MRSPSRTRKAITRPCTFGARSLSVASMVPDAVTVGGAPPRADIPRTAANAPASASSARSTRSSAAHGTRRAGVKTAAPLCATAGIASSDMPTIFAAPRERVVNGRSASVHRVDTPRPYVPRMAALLPPPNRAFSEPRSAAAPPHAAHRRSRRLPWLLTAALAVVAVAALALRLRSVPAPHYVTVTVQRGTLLQTVTAEGTVNPQNLILVGTQVSGTIAELDVDYNAPVRTGQVMAKIDPTTFRDALSQARSTRITYERQYGAGVAGARSAVATAESARRNAAAARTAVDSAVSQVAKAKAAFLLAAETQRRD